MKNTGLKKIGLTLGALSTLFLVACNNSSVDDGRTDYCRSGFMDDLKLEVNGSKKVDLDENAGDVASANLALDAAEVYFHDLEKDVRLRVVQNMNTDESKSSNDFSIKCIGGDGIYKGMDAYEVSIPVVDALNIDETGKTNYSASNLTITLNADPEGQLVQTQLNQGSKGQGSLKTIYDGFNDLEQFYFTGKLEQIRNKMKKTVDSKRNSSSSTINIYTIQQYKSLDSTDN